LSFSNCRFIIHPWGQLENKFRRAADGNVYGSKGKLKILHVVFEGFEICHLLPPLRTMKKKTGKDS
jgi:hypothetical protein